MSERDWELAESLAKSLARDIRDISVAARVVDFLRRHRDWGKVEALLQRWEGTGQLHQSRSTRGYIQMLRRDVLPRLRDRRPDEAARLLGWAVRLARYFSASESQTTQEGRG